MPNNKHIEQIIFITSAKTIAVDCRYLDSGFPYMRENLTKRNEVLCSKTDTKGSKLLKSWDCRKLLEELFNILKFTFSHILLYSEVKL